MLRSMRHFLPRIFHAGLRAPFIPLQLGPIRRIAAESNDLPHLLQGNIPRPHLLQIHARIYRLNSHQNNLVATRLIGHYSSGTALKVFRSLQNPNIFPFNAIIRVLAEDGLLLQSFCVFEELKKSPSLLPNDLTFSFLLKACSCSEDGRDVVNCVKQVHSHIVKSGFVCNGLLMVYAATVKDLVSARQLFDEMPDTRNSLHSWTTLITGYARVGLAEEALMLFVMMLKEEILRPESDTMVSVLSACSSLKNTLVAEKWVNLLEVFVKELPCNDDYVNIVLVYLYGKCRKVEKSRSAFDGISTHGKRNILPWNAMIGAYVQNGCPLEALRVFKSMLENYDCRPNHVTMVNLLSACAEVGDLDLGTWVHEYMKARGHKGVLSSNVNLATALIDMYCKCGDLDGAWEVFGQISKKDVVLFNAMIMGLAVNGKGQEALSLFAKMQDLHQCPNSGTFLGVLYACSHSGLLHKGREIFREMVRSDTVMPRLEHYACYIDLLARSGFIEEALDVVSSMPFLPNDFVWGALLGGCVLHNRLELAHSISPRLVADDPDSSGGYVMLSNSFAADHQWREVSNLRGVMREKGVAKQPGCSWIIIDGVVHEFLAGSASYLRTGSIHQMMESLLKEMRLSTP